MRDIWFILESVSQHHHNALIGREWDKLQGNVKESWDVQDVEANMNLESDMMQKSDAATVAENIVLLMEGAWLKGKPERCKNIK